MAIVFAVPFKVSLLVFGLILVGALVASGSVQAQSPCNPSISQCT